MTRPTCFVFRLWLPLAVGLAIVCGLLLLVRPTAVAGPPQEQPAGTAALWLVPPETLPVPVPWPLVVEAHQAGWQARSAVVEERLAALKVQGRIGGFEPLPGGVGFVVTAPTSLPLEVRRRPEVARVTAADEATLEALAAWWRQGLDAASAVRPALLSTQQATTLTLNLGLHSRLASGSAPRPEPISLSLTREGEVVADATATPFPDGSGGYLYAATLYETTYYGGTGGGGGGCCYFTIEPGDVLQAVQAGQTLSLIVPLLTALADQSTATVYGQAPPTVTLGVYFYCYSDTIVAYQQTVTTTASGDYQADFGGLTPVEPRDYGYVFHANQAGDHVYARYNVPFLRVEVEGDYVGGVAAPCIIVTATLHEDAGALRDLTYDCSSSDGVFSLYFYPAPQVGDTLVVTAAEQVVSTTVPALTAHPDPASEVISGEATAGSQVQVDLYRGPLEFESTYGPPSGDPDYSISITATLTGTYAADFTELTDVVAGDYGALYVTNATGHQAYRRFAVPFLRTRLGDYWLAGQVNGGGQVTVTVWGSSGIPRDVRSVYAYDNGYFYDSEDYWDGGLRLLVGDQVTVIAQNGEETWLTVPLLTAYADQVNSAVHGQAPPNRLLRVEVCHYWYPPGPWVTGGGYSYVHTLWVTSTASGVYTADFSSLTTFQPGYQGAVFFANPEGHEVYLEFTVPVVRVQSGSNYVAGVLHAESDVAITLRDALGQVKATATTQSGYDGSFEVYLYKDWQPATIEAGDVVEVAAGDMLVTVAVPTLTVQADRVADALSGQAPPNTPLEVTWYGGDAWDEPSCTWIVTSTAAGTYSLDLSGEVDLERGDEVEVTWTDENGKVWVIHRVPRLEMTLGDNQVSVLGPVYAPLMLTLLAPGDTPLYTETAMLDASGFARFYLYDPDDYSPILLEAGQTVIADLVGEAITATLPHLTAWVDPVTDIVSGEAPSEARLVVSLDWQWAWLPVTATVTDTYSVDFSGVVDVTSGSSGEVAYLHPDGHRVTLDYAVPHVEVTLGEHCVNCVAPGPGVVTITLRDASGDFKGSGVYTPWHSGSFWVYLTDTQGEPAPVIGGDMVIVEAAGSVTTFTVPMLTVSFDRQTWILTGTAPAGVWLQIALGGGSRQVQAGPDGTYAMDWNDLSPRSGEQGSIVYTDELGSQTRLYFTVPYYNLYLPLVSRYT